MSEDFGSNEQERFNYTAITNVFTRMQSENIEWRKRIERHLWRTATDAQNKGDWNANISIISIRLELCSFF
ncbi:hypothetical protein [Tunturiibacter gelidiferens]|uniref:Uncharacterized protein n=1 Tax=Tunturiibacter gelidiferens TaxID=3069689 RepID=A0AAU7YX50_9BACT